MHSVIIQISTKQDIEHINEDSISEYEYGHYGIDYVNELNDEKRQGFIEDITKDTSWYLPDNTFKVSEDGSIRIISKGTKYEKELFRDIQQKVAKMTFDEFLSNSGNCYWVSELLRNKTKSDVLFHFQEWSGGLCRLDSLLSYARLHYNKTLYIGAILDYHF